MDKVQLRLKRYGLRGAKLCPLRYHQTPTFRKNLKRGFLALLQEKRIHDSEGSRTTQKIYFLR